MKKHAGSITVEAAFVLPIILAVFLMMIWLALYLHDRVLVDSALQRLLQKSGDYIVYGTEPYEGHLSAQPETGRGLLYAVTGSPAKEERLGNWLSDALEGRLFLFQIRELAVDKSGCFLKIRAVLRCDGVSLFSGFLPEGFCEIKREQTVFFAVREELTRAGSIILKQKISGD